MILDCPHLDNLIKLAPQAVPVGSDSHTGCLVLFQQSEVAAITGDDTVLAGLVAQDPYAGVPDQQAFTRLCLPTGAPPGTVELLVHGCLYSGPQIAP